jgi:hypothetical protein
MAWFKKKPDPISDRARALNEEIAALEAQIKNLDSKLQQAPPPAKLRSTAIPHGETIQRAPEPDAASKLETRNPKPETPKPHEPIFEDVDQDRLKSRAETATPEHYNELGVRKYDLPALLRRIRNHFRGPSTNNPKLVHYLAAGGVQGLRPLRYEKRVARNRFILFVAFLFFALLGIILVFIRHH